MRTLSPFTKKDTSQIAANFSFLPFVVGLLRHSSVTQEAIPLPFGEPQALTLETITAIKEIIKRATMNYLTKETQGWKQRTFALPDRDKPIKGRIWHHAVWKNLSLTYTHKSLETLLAAYNLTRVVPKENKYRTPRPTQTKQLDRMYSFATQQGISRRTLQTQVTLQQEKSRELLQQMTLTNNGDLLFHHLVFTKLLHHSSFDRENQQLFFNNPLTLLSHFHFCTTLSEKRLDTLKQLFSPNVSVFLPWLGSTWAKRWNTFDPTKGLTSRSAKTLQKFQQHCAKQANIFNTWCTLAEREERPDTLLCLVEYYHALFRDPLKVDKRYTQFQKKLRNLRHTERTEFIEAWLSILLPARTLHATYENTRSLHPIDREATHHLYINTYKQYSFSTILQTIEELIQRLQPTIG